MRNSPCAGRAPLHTELQKRCAAQRTCLTDRCNPSCRWPRRLRTRQGSGRVQSRTTIGPPRTVALRRAAKIHAPSLVQRAARYHLSLCDASVCERKSGVRARARRRRAGVTGDPHSKERRSGCCHVKRAHGRAHRKRLRFVRAGFRVLVLLCDLHCKFGPAGMGHCLCVRLGVETRGWALACLHEPVVCRCVE